MVRLRLIVAIGLGASLWSVAAVAVSSSQSYETSSPLKSGQIVAMASGSHATVEAATTANETRLVGVVVPGASTTLEYDADSAGVQVASSGETGVFVSDLNGAVQKGDYITASPLAGVGMKATGTGPILGTATSAVDTTTSSSAAVTSADGSKKTVTVGSARVQIAISTIAPKTDASETGLATTGLQSVADHLASHHVSTWRVIVSAGLLVLVLIIISVMVYAAIRGSLLAIGRNPLSSPAIFGSIFQLLVAVLGLLALGVLASFLVIVL